MKPYVAPLVPPLPPLLLTQPSTPLPNNIANLFHGRKGALGESSKTCSHPVNVMGTSCCNAQQMGHCSPERHQQPMLHRHLVQVGQNGELSNSTKEAANCSNTLRKLNKGRVEQGGGSQHTHGYDAMWHPSVTLFSDQFHLNDVRNNFICQFPSE